MVDREQGYIGEPLGAAATAAEKTPRQPTEMDLAYMAGLFDGEGYVCIGFNRNYVAGGTSRSEAAAYRLTIGITMIDESIIKWIHSFWGGSNRITKSTICNANWSTAWHWRVSNTTSEEVLRALYPYLRVKKQQAALGFKFLEIHRQTIRKGTHRAEEMKKLYNKLRALNSKGSKKNWDAVETAHLAPSNGVKIQSELSGDGKSDVSNAITVQ